MRDSNWIRRVVAVMVLLACLVVLPSAPVLANEEAGETAAAENASAESQGSGWLAELVGALSTIFGGGYPRPGETGGHIDPNG